MSPSSLSGSISAANAVGARTRVDNAAVQNWVAMLFVTLGRNWSNSLAESVASWLVQIILLATTIMATRSDTADEHQE